MPTSAQLRELIQRYASVINEGDADAYAVMFTTDALQSDPYPSPPNVGRDSIRAFVKNIFSDSLRFEASEVHSAGDKVAYNFDGYVGLDDGRTMHIRGIEVFTVTEEGLISNMEAYWDDEDRSIE
jgi:steroid Delta-isomerase